MMFSKRSVILAVPLIVLVIVSVAGFWPIQISKVDTQIKVPSNLTSNPIYKVLAQAVSNSTGNISLTLQGFNYTTPDASTRFSASSAQISIVLTPQGQDARVDLDILFDGVNVVSPSFTGRFNSAKMTGFIVVDPSTNKMIVSLVTSTSVLDIIRAVIGF